MKFNVMGEKGNPVVVMLTGSFCPGECLEYIYSRMQDYYIIVPTYNGHYKDAKDFTTRENEAKEIRGYISNLGIDYIRMIYGQSMGSEVGMELYRQLSNEVGCCYTFDFPKLDENMQKHTYFFYGEDEKAYKSCYKLVQTAYPKANYKVEKGHGHMTYSCEYTDKYAAWLEDIIKESV